MESLDIYFAIRRAGHTFASIARLIDPPKGVSRSAVRRVAHGIDKSLRIQTTICRVTGIPFDKMWPVKKSKVKRVA